MTTDARDGTRSVPSAGRSRVRRQDRTLPSRAEGDVATVREALLAWFDTHKRELPWRRSADPYAVWISEVMLQQTRVDVVIPYYRRWMERFPNLGALASADLDDILRVWRGLGYYARARNAHRAARMVRDLHGGVLPSTVVELRSLPGVGEYTAGAVASIAYGEPTPAIDGNARRVVARLFDWPDPSAATLREVVGEMVDPARPGDFNQAMMELGALVCTPRTPSCGVCPMARTCISRASGTVMERPIQKKRKPVRVLSWAVLVAVSPRGHRLVVRRPPEGLLGGLWEFPAVSLDPPEADPEPLVLRRAEYPRRASASAPPEAAPGPAARICGDGSTQGTGPVALPPVTHRFTHFEAVYRPFLVEVDEEWEESRGCWVSAEELGDMPLPVAQQRIALAGAAAFARPTTGANATGSVTR